MTRTGVKYSQKIIFSLFSSLYKILALRQLLEGRGFSNHNFFCRTSLSLSSGTKCTHVTEPITKDENFKNENRTHHQNEIASMKMKKINVTPWHKAGTTKLKIHV